MDEKRLKKVNANLFDWSTKVVASFASISLLPLVACPSMSPSRGLYTAFSVVTHRQPTATKNYLAQHEEIIKWLVALLSFAPRLRVRFPAHGQDRC